MAAVEPFITELRYNGAWNDITPDVQNASPIAIDRGRRDWAATTDPATCTLRLNNGASKVAPGQAGRYSPRNPMSDLYGLIGRNTPIRVRRQVRQNDRAVLPGLWRSYLSTPDTALLDITGDLDVRIEVRPVTWRPDAALATLMSKWDGVLGPQRSWVLNLLEDGRLQFRTTPDGVTAVVSVSTAAVPVDAGRLAVRAVVDVNNGASGNTVTFYTAPSIDGSWTQLGTPVVNAGTTSIFSGTADVTIGGAHLGTAFTGGQMFAGDVFAFEMRAGIAGTVRCRLNLAGHEPEDRTLLDTDGRTWTLYGGATFTDPSIRFTGECSVWPPNSDLSGAEQWVPIKAASISRRLQRGTKPLRSSLYRDLSTKENVVAYWPLEEPEGASRFASGLANDSSFLRPGVLAEVDVAEDGDTFVASAPLPAVHDTTIWGAVPSYVPNASQRFIFLVSVPRAGLASEKLLARFLTSGSVARIDLRMTSGGGIRTNVYDGDDVLLHTVLSGDAFNGRPHMLSVWYEQQGTSVFYQVARFELGASAGFVLGSSTFASKTFGRFTTVFLGSDNDVEGCVFGHAALMNGDVHSIWDIIGDSLEAWSGESAAARLVRLAADFNLPAPHVIGDGSTTAAMGPQLLVTLTDLLEEIPLADMGLLGDRRDALGHALRTRDSLYNQQPALVIDYAAGVIAGSFQPTDDDQATRNEVTVERLRGSKYTLTEETGPLSVQDPPDGVGVYDYSETVSIAADAQLPDQTGWRLHLGTIDEPRFPNVTVELHADRTSLMAEEIQAVDEGDLIRIVNMPKDKWPGEVLDLLVEAIHEEKTAETHVIDFTCSPGSAWAVGVWAADTDTPGPTEARRYDTAGSVLNASIADTNTTFQVTTTAGPRWYNGLSGLRTLGTTGSYASTPDAAALDITGDIDLRVDFTPAVWPPPFDWTLIGKYGDTGNQRSYRLDVTTAGILRITWSTDGTGNTSMSSTIAAPIAAGRRLAVRATLDVNNGASGKTAVFYIAGELDEAWSQLGAAVTTAGTTSIFSGTAALEVGARNVGASGAANVWVWAAQVRNGIDGTIAATPRFNSRPLGTGPFADSAGRTWSVNGTAAYANWDFFDIAVGGEHMRVTGIAEATPTLQTFRVTRAVNGISKSHAAGAAVALAYPARYAL